MGVRGREDKGDVGIIIEGRRSGRDVHQHRSWGVSPDGLPDLEEVFKHIIHLMLCMKRGPSKNVVAFEKGDACKQEELEGVGSGKFIEKEKYMA